MHMTKGDKVVLDGEHTQHRMVPDEAFVKELVPYQVEHEEVPLLDAHDDVVLPDHAASYFLPVELLQLDQLFPVVSLEGSGAGRGVVVDLRLQAVDADQDSVVADHCNVGDRNCLDECLGF